MRVQPHVQGSPGRFARLPPQEVARDHAPRAGRTPSQDHLALQIRALQGPGGTGQLRQVGGRARDAHRTGRQPAGATGTVAEAQATIPAAACALAHHVQLDRSGPRRRPATHRLDPLSELVPLTACRGPIETCFQQCKQHLGMGHYEVRSWTGWHHHMTLCLLAHFFLVQLQVRLKKKAPALTVPQVHAVLPQLLPRFLPTLNQALDFLIYRERYNLAARWTHIRRQLRDDPLAA